MTNIKSHYFHQTVELMTLNLNVSCCLNEVSCTSCTYRTLAIRLIRSYSLDGMKPIIFHRCVRLGCTNPYWSIIYPFWFVQPCLSYAPKGHWCSWSQVHQCLCSWFIMLSLGWVILSFKGLERCLYELLHTSFTTILQYTVVQDCLMLNVAGVQSELGGAAFGLFAPSIWSSLQLFTNVFLS